MHDAIMRGGLLNSSSCILCVLVICVILKYTHCGWSGVAIYDFNQSDGKTYKSEYHQDTREIPFSMKTNKQLVVVHQELVTVATRVPQSAATCSTPQERLASWLCTFSHPRPRKKTFSHPGKNRLDLHGQGQSWTAPRWDKEISKKDNRLQKEWQTWAFRGKITDWQPQN